MKLAIIGYGGMGEYHADQLRKYCESDAGALLRIGGVYDTDPARMQAARERGLRVYADPNEIWNDEQTQAVLLSVPNDLHAPYAFAAARAGKHVLCEKPVALSTAQAKQMFRAAARQGVLFTVHQNRRYDEDFLTVRNIIAGGELGDVYKIESRVMGSNGIPGAWRKQKARGGGMMPDWGVHLIDQMLQAVPAPVVRLYCEYSYIYGEEVEDGCDLSLHFANGVQARIVVATDCFRRLPRWMVYGTEGTATIEDWDLSGGMTRVVEREDRGLVGMRAGNGFTKTMAQRSDASVRQLPLPVVRAEPFAFYRNFARACAGEEPAVVQESEVLRVFRIMEEAARSAKTHRALRVRI